MLSGRVGAGGKMFDSHVLAIEGVEFSATWF